MPQIRVFHCDDSPSFTRLVRAWLDDHEDIELVGEAHTAGEALDGLASAQPHVVLLDTMGAPGDGALLRRIRETVPEARVIVYSGYLSIVDSDRLGGEADGYLAKGDDDHALVSMIRAAAG
jgi:two-component system, NarL family, response regulator DevR